MSLPPPRAGQSSPSWPVRVDPVYLCWHWLGRLSEGGYGPHRQVYEAEVGEIPQGMMLDHWCRRRDCCNPMHLEPVKQSTNERRKSWAWRTKLKQCQHGHDLYLHGRRTPEGGKICLVCG